MTSIETALNSAWFAHDLGKVESFEHLHTAVVLINYWIKAQEARSLLAGLPQDAPEAPAGTNPSPDWESRCNRLEMAIAGAILYMQRGLHSEAEETLRKSV
jgi:hypothetical protein